MTKYILQFILPTIAFVVIGSWASIADAKPLRLNLNESEIGVVDPSVEDAKGLKGIKMHIPGSRLASETDFEELVPVLCDKILVDILRIAKSEMQIDTVGFIIFQVEFYGPKIGETEPYVATSAKVDLEDGLCVL